MSDAMSRLGSDQFRCKSTGFHDEIDSSDSPPDPVDGNAGIGDCRWRCALDRRRCALCRHHRWLARQFLHRRADRTEGGVDRRALRAARRRLQDRRLWSGLAELEGIHTSKGASDIIADAEDVLTLKCESCGAEVVIDTASAGQARCHWCRNMLSINSAIPNGAVPDVVLPFNVTKVDAQAKIDEFVGKRKFFAHPQFTKEFTSENICGVYFPYMIIDVNAHSYLSGTGEKLVRKYTVKNGDREEDRYDADAYHVERDFDITIDDLTVEASADKLNVSSNEKTTNIINSIMPFDTDKCVEYNANYLRGYTSQKRDVNVDHIRQLVKTQSNDIARFAANDTLEKYDRGVAWDIDNFEVKGESWNAAYLPVWLYSYMQVKGKKNLLHYVAVNARTKETMGSVPINMTKLCIVSIII